MKFFNKFAIYLSLFLITIIGGFLRFYNLNWDDSFFFHPDERNIDIAVSKIHFFSQLNPDFFAYGSFPLYFYRLAGNIIVAVTHNYRWVTDWGYINLIGRGFSAFFSTLTIILVFLITKKISDKKTSLLAAFLTAFTVSLIQTAHFGVTESLLVFENLLIVLFSLELVHKPNPLNYIKVGSILGLSVATKVSAISFFIIPLSIYSFYYLKQPRFYLKLIILFLFLFSALVFVLTSPYVLLDHIKFLESMNYESGVATGKLKVVYTMQFEKTIPYLFQIKNFFWQTGLNGLLGLLGIIFLVNYGLLKRNKKILAFLIFPIAYFLYVGSWYTKFVRYMLPLLPFFNIFAAGLLIKIFQRHRKFGFILIVLTASTAFIWSFTFFSIYTRESTRISASKWIYQNVPKNSKVLTEHWDDGLPIDYSGTHPDWYQTSQLTIYEPDNLQKVDYYASELSKADYIFINSRRLYGTLINLPDKYPVTSRYYQYLFGGQLGYTLVAQFTSYPQIFGFTINDDQSEETFQVYDHPKVLIFKNFQHLTEPEIRQTLTNGKIIKYDQ